MLSVKQIRSVLVSCPCYCGGKNSENAAFIFGINRLSCVRDSPVREIAPGHTGRGRGARAGHRRGKTTVPDANARCTSFESRLRSFLESPAFAPGFRRIRRPRMLSGGI